jgi:hypothetical protein
VTVAIGLTMTNTHKRAQNWRVKFNRVNKNGLMEGGGGLDFMKQLKSSFAEFPRVN